MRKLAEAAAADWETKTAREVAAEVAAEAEATFEVEADLELEAELAREADPRTPIRSDATATTRERMPWRESGDRIESGSELDSPWLSAAWVSR